MKVLHVIPSVSLRRGGPSAAIGPMTGALQELGVECSVVTTNDDGPDTLNVPLERWIDHAGMRTWFLPRFSPPVRALREFAWSPGFPRWMHAQLPEFDIVHVHALFSYVSSRAMMLARRRGVPYVLRPLGLLEEWSLTRSPFRKRMFLALCDRANLRGAAAVHFTSTREMEMSLHVPAGLGFVAPLGVAVPEVSTEVRKRTRAGLGAHDSECVFLFLSRWHPKKRIKELLEALATLREQRWILVLAGAGDQAHERMVREHIHQLGLRDRVRTPGFVEGEVKWGLFAAADAFVLPSHSENFGIAVAEAMAAGVPPIVSDGVALSSDIFRGNVGWVAGNDVRSLAAALEEALNDPKERAVRGQGAAALARAEYSWRRSSERIAAQYERILKSRMRP